MTDQVANPRREVKARGTLWARRAAAGLSKMGMRPNTISILSIAFAAAAGGLLILSGCRPFPQNTALLVGAAVLIQCRLLANLFDGMVAVEGGMGTPSGILFNDFPDRIADPLIFVCAGYAVQDMPCAVELGWLAGVLSVFTAYVRVLAGASGAKQKFLGPMAKQHRMALITVAILASAVAARWDHAGPIMVTALAVISGGCIITALRRLAQAVRELETK
jgi:phosphatidylglycerophosphate synthase